MHNADALAHLRTLLFRDGVRAALAFLNSLTLHRFTALYRFDNERLRNLYLFDREDPTVTSSPDIPVTASYCVFVRDSCRTFALSDSLHDGRVAGHPKRQQVQSYCGVPLLDEDGKLFGTICHFDFRPIPISGADVELLEAMAPLLQQVDRLAKESPPARREPDAGT